MPKLSKKYIHSLKEEGSELICHQCGQVIVPTPDQYENNIIRSIINMHKLAHVISGTYDKETTNWVQ